MISLGIGLGPSLGVIHHDYVLDDRDDLVCLDIMVGFWEAMLWNDNWIKVAMADWLMIEAALMTAKTF